MSIPVPRTSVTVNILKKYSRAAGDRIQWKKVEAMFDKSEKRRQFLGLGGAGHVVRSPPFVALFTVNTQSDGQHNTTPTRIRYTIRMVID